METPDATGSRVALVTGAAQGVGLGIAQSLAEAGYRVMLCDLQLEIAEREAQALSNGGNACGALRLDVASVESWQLAATEVEQTLGRLDLLVNNAGISPRGTVETVDEALWNRTLDINLKGAWLGIKACLPLLRAARGSIVNIGTTRATRPRKDLFVYGISKAGLLGLTRYVAIDLFEDGVTCNMVAPGWVDTPGERVLQARHGNPAWPEGTRNLIDPRDVGAAVVYLASKAGRRVNGDLLYVDAGLHCADDVASVFQVPDDSAPR
jgi:3-oxoacyl-[acyl-carrier protein] reductase